MNNFLQFLAAGITSGAIYALIGLGFSIIFNASKIINLAQGEFVTLGGIVTATLLASGAPLLLAVPGSVLVAVLAGMLMEKLTIEPVRRMALHTVIMVTVGVSIFLQGLIQVVFGKGLKVVPAFSGDTPISIGGASIAPQNFWVLGALILCVALLWVFFNKTKYGKAMLAASQNPVAAELVGIDVRRTLLASFACAGLLGGVAGAVAAPITLTSYDTGVMLGLKGFVAATLGGLGSGPGAVMGGIVLGIIEAFAAGYISSSYRDAIPFLLIVPILLVLPNGLLGLRGSVDRV